MPDQGQSPEARRRLLWQCRRGMKELDLLLSRFARERYDGVSPQLQRAFEQFLELSDPQINEYLLGYVTSPDPARAAVIEAILGR